MPSGTIKMFNEDKGFGFIKSDDGGDDVFFHVSAYGEEIIKGNAVTFEARVDPKSGESRAAPASIWYDLTGAPAVPGHPLPLSLEESSSLGSGGIFERGTGVSESGLGATSLFRVNARPSKLVAIKIAPPIISQCGNSIDESRPIYFPFAFSPAHLGFGGLVARAQFCRTARTDIE